MPDELVAVLICEKMGWDWETYEQQPVWFIRLIFAKLGVDGEFNQQKLKDANKPS